MNEMKHGCVVWIVDDEQWPRACLRAELIERGCDAVGFTKLNRALSTLRSRRVVWPAVIVLELRGQELTRATLDALAGTRIPVVLLGGAQEMNDPLVRESKFAAALKRPVTLGAIADSVLGLVSSAGAPPRE